MNQVKVNRIHQSRRPFHRRCQFGLGRASGDDASYDDDDVVRQRVRRGVIAVDGSLGQMMMRSLWVPPA